MLSLWGKKDFVNNTKLGISVIEVDNMEELLLINNIDPETSPYEELVITFVIQNIQEEYVQKALNEVLQEFHCKMTVRVHRHGVSVKILKHQIPQLVRAFCDKGLEIFGIYHFYYD